MFHYMPAILGVNGLIAKSFFRVLCVAIERRELVSSLHLWGILSSDNLSPPGHLPWLEAAGNVLSRRQNFQLG